MQFLSTPSARRATVSASVPSMPMYYFYPRPPQGGRPHAYKDYASIIAFLSTPSARRATSSGSSDTISVELFLSTPSARRATHHKAMASGSLQISIHALREEGDSAEIDHIHRALKFLSTPSARRATRMLRTISITADFYPRPPRGGRLSMPGKYRPCLQISIHALRKEGDHVRQ